MPDRTNRRPIKTRSAGWVNALARALGTAGLSPNMISTIGMVFAAGGALCFLLVDRSPLYFLGAAAGIQLRLLANVLDGLVAVEGGKGSATGPLYNEFPDRVEDAFLLIAAGYAAGQPLLGYGATILAFATAYIRASGGALGCPQDFVGPMAKQHRMFVLTVGAAASALALDLPLMQIALWVIAIGSAVTCMIRTVRIARLLKSAQG